MDGTMAILALERPTFTFDVTRHSPHDRPNLLRPAQTLLLLTFQFTLSCKRRQLPTTMFKASLLVATFAFAATAVAADQVATKGSLVIGASQNLAEATICLDGHSTCHALRKLEVEVEELERALKQEGNSSAQLLPANETTGTPEIVCFGICCTRCYDYTRRRLQDVYDEHRRLEATGESELQDIECFNQPWGLQCS